jgi:ribosomal-protein-alanine N-acetyltransferase
VIRSYDLAAVASLHALCFDEPWRPELIRRIIEGPGGFGLFARVDGAVLGFVLCRTTGSDGEVLSLGVTPAERNRGIARSLMKAATDAARDRGLRHLYLEVAEDNTSARRLYAAIGFMQVGRRCGYYKRAENTNVDALTLRREIMALPEKPK